MTIVTECGSLYCLCTCRVSCSLQHRPYVAKLEPHMGLFFSKVKNTASKAKCYACDKLLSSGTDKPSKQTTLDTNRCTRRNHIHIAVKFTNRRQRAKPEEVIILSTDIFLTMYCYLELVFLLRDAYMHSASLLSKDG